jgi:hypothetical protein
LTAVTTNDSDAAHLFASRFYAAIAAAQPVGIALEQGKAAMLLAALDDADTKREIQR